MTILDEPIQINLRADLLEAGLYRLVQKLAELVALPYVLRLRCGYVCERGRFIIMNFGNQIILDLLLFAASSEIAGRNLLLLLRK